MSYSNLANAIIKQAYMDLVWSMRMTAPFSSGDYKATYEKGKKRRIRDDCNEFFNGDWYKTLTTLDPAIFYERAYTEKAKSRVGEWMYVLQLNERRRCNRAKKMNWGFRVRGNRIIDKRYYEYKKRVRARKKRMKEQEKRR